MTEQPPRAYSTNMVTFDPSIGIRLVIKLDGVEQSKVIAYDCDAGQVLRYTTHDERSFKVNRDRDDAEIELLCGDVTVEFRQGDGDAPHERCGKYHPLPG